MPTQSFRLRDLAAVIVLVAFLFALSVPVGEASGHSSRRMQHKTQLHGIHQGLVTFANSNRNFFPGIDESGVRVAPDVEDRWGLLMEGDFITPEYAVSPLEPDATIQEWDDSQPLSSSNYSYAMLQIPAEGGRYAEWSQSLNSQAIVLSYRNTGTEQDTLGIQNERSESSSLLGCTYNTRQPYLEIGHWVGDVLYNDNHVTFLETDKPDTDYAGHPNPEDRLFSSEGDDDALLIHSGN